MTTILRSTFPSVKIGGHARDFTRCGETEQPETARSGEAAFAAAAVSGRMLVKVKKSSCQRPLERSEPLSRCLDPLGAVKSGFRPVSARLLCLCVMLSACGQASTMETAPHGIRTHATKSDGSNGLARLRLYAALVRRRNSLDSLCALRAKYPARQHSIWMRRA